MSLLKFLLSQYLKLKQTSKPAATTSGFTLIELLVAMIIAALIIGTLLSFMLNIVTTDRREQAKSTTEQELQAAIDYIARDLAQAVYVYDADGISRNNNSDPALSGIRNQIPPAQPAGGCNTTTPTCEPILVFWKRTSLPRDLPVTSGGTNTTVGCLFKLADGTTCNGQDQFVYSLVAYYLIRDTSTTTNWSNAARIGRFEIRDGIRTTDTSKPSRSEVIAGQTKTVNYALLPSTGFMPPNLSLSGDLKARMNQWTKHSDAYNTNVDILVDYVDQSSTASLPFTCAAPQRVPLIASTVPNSFYTCVDSTRNLAQVYIRGNALARFNRVPPPYSQIQSAYFPTTQIQVEGRGFLNAR